MRITTDGKQIAFYQVANFFSFFVDKVYVLYYIVLHFH